MLTAKFCRVFKSNKRGSAEKITCGTLNPHVIFYLVLSVFQRVITFIALFPSLRIRMVPGVGFFTSMP